MHILARRQEGSGMFRSRDSEDKELGRDAMGQNGMTTGNVILFCRPRKSGKANKLC